MVRGVFPQSFRYLLDAMYHLLLEVMDDGNLHKLGFTSIFTYSNSTGVFASMMK